MEQKDIKKRLTLKEYFISLDYTFEEFDKEDYDGSYYTRWGKLGDFDLFTEEQIDIAIEEGLCEPGVMYFDHVTKDDIENIIDALLNNLDHGAIKLLEITEGEDIIYSISNDEPYED